MTNTTAGPDAVVIGAGHNGLVAANLLADEGWEVVVYEATAHPGGAVRSGEFIEPGFITDLFSAFYPLGLASPVMRRLQLERYGLEWCHAPSVLAHVLPDDRCAVLTRDAERTAAGLDEFAVGDGDAWLAMTDEWRQIETPLLGILFDPFPPVRAATKLLRTLGPAKAARLARLAITPVRQLATERFAGEGAGLILAGNALHADLPPEGAGSALYGWLLAMMGQSVGFPAPRGGSGGIIDALVTRLKSLGGTVVCNSPVERVLVSDGAATGVRLASGEVVTARRAVLADTSAPALFGGLVPADELPARLVSDMATSFQWDASTLKLNWTLNGPIPWTAEGARDAGTVHLGADMNGLTDYAASLATERRPDPVFMLLGQMTTTDADRSPAGTESVWAYTHVPRSRSHDNELLDEQIDAAEATIEARAPGFKSLIRNRLVQRPADLEAANPNLVSGAVNGGTAGLHQQLIFRPTMSVSRAETAVDKLFLASAAAHPGGGVHGGPGSNAARAALLRSTRFGLRNKVARAALRRMQE